MYNNDFDYNQNSSNSELYAKVRPYVHGDEQILWIGKPTRAKSAGSFFLVPFAIFWLGFAIFWTVMATTGAGAFGLFGIPFICVGIGLLYFAVIGNRKSIMNSVYAVTDRRAIIITHSRRGANCTEYSFARIPGITLENVSGTVGDIRFASDYINGYGGSYYNNRPNNIGSSNRTAFIGIENVNEVYMLISDQIGKSN